MIMVNGYYEIYAINNDKTIDSLVIPSNSTGLIGFDRNRISNLLNKVYFENVDNKWLLIVSGDVSINQKSPVQTKVGIELSQKNRDLLLTDKQDKTILQIRFTVKPRIFRYALQPDTNLLIGHGLDSDIISESTLVSRHHALISFDGRELSIRDLESTNGTYLNGNQIDSGPLKLGDVVYIGDFKIMIGSSVIGINVINKPVHVKSEKLYSIDRKIISGNYKRLKEDEIIDNFERGPRFRMSMNFKPITIEQPPFSMDDKKVPLMLRMGSQMIMSGSAALSGNYMMLMSSLFFPIMNQKYTEKQKKEYEEKRQVLYSRYLEEKKDEIYQEKHLEEKALKYNYQRPDYVLDYPLTLKRLWERRYYDDDFLVLRVGHGEQDLIAEIDYPKERFSLDTDDLEERMYQVAQMPVKLERSPVLLDLKEYFITCINGEAKLTYSFLKNMLIRLSILYSPDELKIVLLANKKQQKYFSFLRNFPHCWNNNFDFRYCAQTSGEAYQVGENIFGIVEESLSENRRLTEIMKKHPYFLIVSLDKSLLDGIEFLKEYYKTEKSKGISVLTCFPRALKDCKALIKIRKDKPNSVNYVEDLEKPRQIFSLDRYDRSKKQKCIRRLSNIRLAISSEMMSLPKSISFLEMFKVRRIEELNIQQRWELNNAISSIQTEIGVSSDGSPFMLDLHQKFQGPHGLVAGTTGSGKSEFLITYILSLAVNYHPDDVGFILIDYKGGGLAGAFEDQERGIHLPHLLGTITNLDGASMGRSLVSLESELKRRQRVFNRAKTIADAGTMDIYEYQKLYKAGKLKEPVPHLFIISDEFAELKSQRPEFMDQLISAARIGRSLGIHLILATQKPSGVVNEQIRSNTKFRICLKVAERADSNDMIERPDAAEIKETGRFYLQVGYNEFFAMGQSAWSGAPYAPDAKEKVKEAAGVQILDNLGQTETELKEQVKRRTDVSTQLVDIVKYISKLAVEMDMEPKTLWLPVMSPRIPLDLSYDLSERNEPVLGLVDDPLNQSQFKLVMSLDKVKGTQIIGESGYGKSIFLQSLILEYSSHYSPEDFWFYALDYSGGALKRFERLPHCGGIAVEEEDDKAAALFKLIEDLIVERKKIFTEYDVNTFSELRQAVKVPHILVFIDNIIYLNESKGLHDYYFKIASLVKNGSKYGISFICTAIKESEIPSQLKPLLTDKISFFYTDSYTYQTFFGFRVGVVLPDMPGRAIIPMDGRYLEVQIAMRYPGLSGKARSDKLREDIERITDYYKNSTRARKLPVVDDNAEFSEFLEEFQISKFPLGISKGNGKHIGIPYKQFSMLSAYFGNPKGTQELMSNLSQIIIRDKADVLLFKKAENSVMEFLLDSDDVDLVGSYESNAESVQAGWTEAVNRLMPRKDLLVEYCKENAIDPTSADIANKTFYHMRKATKPFYIIIESFSELCSCSSLLHSKLMEAVAGLARQYNTYIIAFFYPDDDPKMQSHRLFNSFNPDHLFLLYGGNFGKQYLIGPPADEPRPEQVKDFRDLKLVYRNELHNLYIPCGKVEEVELDEDDMSII